MRARFIYTLHAKIIKKIDANVQEHENKVQLKKKIHPM